jgi:hypothetical protein
MNAQTKRFFLSKRFLALPIAIAIYLTVTLNWHFKAASDFDAWLTSQRTSSPIVYVTFSGRSYHTSGHYIKSAMRSTLFDAARSSHSPCMVCSPPRMSLTDEQRTRRAPSFFGYGTALVFCTILYFIVIMVTFPESSPEQESTAG